MASRHTPTHPHTHPPRCRVGAGERESAGGIPVSRSLTLSVASAPPFCLLFLFFVCAYAFFVCLPNIPRPLTRRGRKCERASEWHRRRRRSRSASGFVCGHAQLTACLSRRNWGAVCLHYKAQFLLRGKRGAVCGLLPLPLSLPRRRMACACVGPDIYYSQI